MRKVRLSTESSCFTLLTFSLEKGTKTAVLTARYQKGKCRIKMCSGSVLSEGRFLVARSRPQSLGGTPVKAQWGKQGQPWELSPPEFPEQNPEPLCAVYHGNPDLAELLRPQLHAKAPGSNPASVSVCVCVGFHF